MTNAEIDSIFENLPGFTKREREWLRGKLRTALKTVHAVQGRNCYITDTSDGQKIDGADCDPCP